MGVSSSKDVSFTHFFKPNESRPGQVRFCTFSSDTLRHFAEIAQGEEAVLRFRAMKCE